MIKHKRELYCFVLIVVVVMALISSCGGPEAKKMKFYNKGKSLYEKGDFVKVQKCSSN